MVLFTVFFGLSISTGAWSFPEVAHPSAESATCLKCHGDTPAREPRTQKRAPLLPEQFSMRWSMFEFTSSARPPFDAIAKPRQVLRGTTHYDWTKQSMTEVYHDKCIDIFPRGRDFPCQFTSVGNKTYLLRFNGPGATSPDSCCLWNQTGFWAPRPDVIRNLTFDKSQKIHGAQADWWVLDIPLPGPFGYGFFRNSGAPAAFWFPVISGWVQQNFTDFEAAEPHAKVFEVPSICTDGTAAVCQP